jgi:hypothetical protein
MRHICLGQPDKSAVVEHSIEAGHNIDFNNIMMLEKVTGYMDRLVKEQQRSTCIPTTSIGTEDSL